MLILPLHRPLTRAHFPYVTLGLILANVFVFFALQGRDAALDERAWAQFRDSGLAAIELPAYRDWRVRTRNPRADTLPPGIPPALADRLLFERLQADAGFQQALHAERVVPPGDARYAAWQEARAALDAVWARQFTPRYVLRFSEIDPLRMLAAMFLHGSVGHLVGNLVFLGLLGLLVEGALGAGLFLALYLVGGLGGQLASLAWRWGEVGTALGASGAIAALMGAYCVLWGLRRVRFFWWFFVVFDYVKAPALILLPLWLGWELLNLLFNPDVPIGFDAHAGGMVSGALLAAAVRGLGWERREFLDVEARADARKRDAQQLAQALEHLSRLRLVQARGLLQALDDAAPGQWPVRQALYRCARYGQDAAALHAAARAALEAGAGDARLRRERKALFDDYVQACGGRPRVPPALLLQQACDALALDAPGDAERLLRSLAAAPLAPPGLAEACFALAQCAAPADVQRARLDWVAARFADHAVAAKARFLRSELGG